MEKKPKKKVIDAWAVMLKDAEEYNLFTTIGGLGVFDHKPWADFLAKKIGEKYTKVIPCEIIYKI